MIPNSDWQWICEVYATYLGGGGDDMRLELFAITDVFDTRLSRRIVSSADDVFHCTDDCRLAPSSGLPVKERTGRG